MPYEKVSMKFFRLIALSLTILGSCGKPKSAAVIAKEPAAPPVDETQPVPIRGKDYKLVFEDNFDGPEGASASKERWSDWALGERKDAFNVADACRLDGKGKLVITVRRNNDRIETGGIWTRKKFEATHGYYECRCKPHNASGAWSAFWIQTPTMGKPPGDASMAGVEIDVLESFPGHWKHKGHARHTAHWGGYDKANHKTESVGKELPGIADDFHTFAVKWDEEGYVFFIDGVESGRWMNVPISNRPEFLIVSCEAMKWSGKIEDAKLPDSFVIDHVRVWQTDAQIAADAKRPEAIRLGK